MSETQEQYQVSETVSPEPEQPPETERTSPTPTIPDPFLRRVLQRVQKVEDRLVLACFPVVLLALLLWALAAVLPPASTALNFAVTVLVVVVSCVMMLRLGEIAWHWTALNRANNKGELDLDDIFGYWGGAVACIVLVITGIGCMIDAIVEAGHASGGRTSLIVGLILLLVIQYQAIIRRHLSKPVA